MQQLYTDLETKLAALPELRQVGRYNNQLAHTDKQQLALPGAFIEIEPADLQTLRSHRQTDLTFTVHLLKDLNRQVDYPQLETDLIAAVLDLQSDLYNALRHTATTYDHNHDHLAQDRHTFRTFVKLA